MSRTSRTARAVAAVRPSVPFALLLPLLVGAFLVGLWILGTTSAFAEEATSGRGPIGTDALLRGSLVGEPHGDGDPVSATLVRKGSTSLDEVVTDELVAPVSATLGGVHQRLEQGAERTVAVLPETSLVDGVGESARRVVRELEHGAAEDLLVPASSEVNVSSPLPVGESGETGAGTRPSKDGAEPETAHGPSLDPTPPTVFVTALVEDFADTTGKVASSPAPVAQTPTPSMIQATTGSASPSAGSAPVPAVAGYLMPAPFTAPSAGTVLFSAHGLYPVPSGPSDDLTVSPD